MNALKKIGLPRVTMLRDEAGNPRYARSSDNYAQHEMFKLAEDYPLNAGWELKQHGIVLTLVYERDLTVAVIMGSWEDGSEAYGVASSAGDDEVACYQDKFLMDDVPEYVNKEDLYPVVIELFYNHMLFETLDSYLPSAQLDTSSHVTV